MQSSPEVRAGIGHAISIALKHKGCRVAATYAGNDAAARQFQAETGIPVYKWDVGDYAACQEGVTRITRDLGPIDVLVNNAGITARRHAASHDQGELGRGDPHQPRLASST